MEKSKKLISITIILIVISYFILCLFSNPTYAVNQVMSTDINGINESAYPGIKDRINALKVKYPNWNFKILYTDLDWNEVISQEYVGHGKSPRNVVQAISNYQGAWICPCGYVDGSWRCASEDAIRYMMDPRNSLNASDIFQFEELTNNGYDRNQIISMTNGTFLQGHHEEIIRAGDATGISAYFIIARMLQEQGKGGTPLTSGVHGYYNPFNIQANGTDPIVNGVAYAKKQGWDTLEKGIVGGINFLSDEYTKKGQNTLYLQKFDVDDTYNGLYWHQYMQNIMAAQSEGNTLRKTYESINAVGNSHTFIIPVYKNMPKVACSRPNGNADATVSSDIVKVNVNSTISLRSSPNGPKISALLYKDEIVTRIEKATSKVAGTYWDKIRKADGTEAYVARETYDYEQDYKLYLVPVNSGSGDVVVPPEEPSNPPTPPVEEPPAVAVTKGDVNGDGKITSSDYVLIKNHIMGTSILNETGKQAADYNGDGNITSSDYVLIKNYIMSN